MEAAPLSTAVAWLMDGPVYAIGGVLWLLTLLYGKFAARQFRRRAVSVEATVLKRTPFRYHTSYLVEYETPEGTRVAEYRGAPLRVEYEADDRLSVLVPSTGEPSVHAGTEQDPDHCVLASHKSTVLWDVIHVMIGLALIGRAFA